MDNFLIKFYIKFKHCAVKENKQPSFNNFLFFAETKSQSLKEDIEQTYEDTNTKKMD
ncbi:Uncharacterised protein [Legionella israelensis]|uniref:Uncharacterized protein n=1 Tax=Legionella israelensis TaxID=454 RepID=A0A0W0VKH8_9GAMM|nr:hypothetical protein Lisr_1701 [Legionella israelensis]SCY13306.1 hypothetical protein SAMN02746069_01394 [Legionella israelensis DSM 19235]STX59376.1 Uncharacterised protein [Legionella israelensis]